MNDIPFPTPPRTLEETGLPQAFVINLICKVMNVEGTLTPGEIAATIALPKSMTRHLIEEMVTQKLVESKGLASTDIRSDIRYALTERGRKWALDAMAVSHYVGPAPVTLEAFEAQVRTQSIANERIGHTRLSEALDHLVLPEGIMTQLGPAVNSGRSVLLYGEAGNGKTSIAEAMGSAFNDTIYLPYAIFVRNQVIQFFDETIHDVVEDEESEGKIDPRWIACRRPVVKAGGELRLDMLDLIFEPTSRVYEAPMHMKAIGGVFIIDDFGRQRERPQAFLNRWIGPLEKGFDILSLHTGKKFTVPFDQLVIFSTNIPPDELADNAALRRLFFKVHVPTPTRDEYIRIFEEACLRQGVPCDRHTLETFFDDLYIARDRVPSGAHPNFLIRHILSAAAYLDRPPRVTQDFLSLASRNLTAEVRAPNRPHAVHEARVAGERG